MSELDELRQEILKQSYVDTTVIRWSKLPDEPIEQKAQAIVEIPIDDLMDIIELFIANQVREARIDELKRFDRSSEEMTKLIPLKIGERLYELTKQKEQE